MMKVLGKKVLVRQDAAVSRRGAILLPQGKEEYPNFGTILAVGGEVTDIAVGDRVLFKRKPESALAPDSRQGDDMHGLLVLPEDNILAVITGEMLDG